MTSEDLTYLKKLCYSPEYGIPEGDVTKVYGLLSSMLSELPFRDSVGKRANIREEFKREKEYTKLFALTMINEDLPIFALFEDLDLLIKSDPGNFKKLETLKEQYGDKAKIPYLTTVRRIIQRYIRDTKPIPESSSQKKVEEISPSEKSTENKEKSSIDEYVRYMAEKNKNR
jgi:hypothetical protein